MRPRLLLLLATSTLIGCVDKTPAGIEVPQASLTMFDHAPHELGVRLVTRGGTTLDSPALSYSVTPPGVVTMSPTGAASCITNGDATAIVAGGGQSATVTLSCRIVASIGGPDSMRLVLGREPTSLDFRPLDGQGQPIPAAPLEVVSENPAVAIVEGGIVRALGVGTTTLLARSGGVVLRVGVAIVEMIKSEPLVLADGASITYTLQQGDYDLDLEVKPTDKRLTGVTVSWVGTSCLDAPEAQKHAVSCQVDGTASLTITNPSVLGLGPAMTGYINLYRARR